MFRFTIRDVLWLTVVVAMGAGWWLEFKQRGPENVKLREANTSLLLEHERMKVSNSMLRRLLDSSQSIIAKREATVGERERQVHALLRDHAERLSHEYEERFGVGDDRENNKFMPAEPGDWQMKGRPTPR